METPARTLLPIELEDVGYAVRKARPLVGVSGVFSQGPLTVVIGPNGAGKSVLLRLCHGLLEPSSGKIRLGLETREDRIRAQAMVFQRPVLLRRSAAANVDYALKLRGVSAADRPGRVRAALEAAGLGSVASRAARVLSGGEQQRLAIARAWALRPEVLFLDEPTASLDPQAVQHIEGLVRSIHRSGTKVIMTTHDLGQAKRLADEIWFLHRGRLVECAAAEEFFRSPATSEAQTFLEGKLLL